MTGRRAMAAETEGKLEGSGYYAESGRRAAEPAQLRLDLDGYEGPLDVMLYLAQTKKLDLSKISVLPLAEQYLRFVERAGALDAAGEYLLMAAALVFMKSCLALPQRQDRREAAEESAEKLRFRLNRLAAFRTAAQRLFRRDLLGAGLFARGAPSAIRIAAKTEYQADLAGLLSAYAALEQRRRKQKLSAGRAPGFWPLAEAQQTVSALLAESARRGGGGAWLNLPEALAAFAARNLPSAARKSGKAGFAAQARRSVQASGFAAGLELARRGKAELRQAEAFSPLYLRAAGKAKRAEKSCGAGR